jgi:hypothetical protein
MSKGFAGLIEDEVWYQAQRALRRRLTEWTPHEDDPATINARMEEEEPTGEGCTLEELLRP